MKKFLIVIILTLIFVCVVSCSNIKSNDTTDFVSTIVTTETTTSEETIVEEVEKGFAYPINNKFIETPSRVIYPNASIMNYYNKVTGEAFLLCFDPLCDHSVDYCLSMSFFETGLVAPETFGYCEVNQRIYILRGENLFSFGFDGSDIRNELSYGDSGKYFGREGLMYFKCRVLQYLSVYDKYVVFLHENPNNGILELMVYDAVNSSLVNISEELEINAYTFVQYVMCESRIVFSIVKDSSYEYYSYDLISGDSKQIISKGVFVDLELFDGEFIYGVLTAKENGDVKMASIVKMNVDTGEYSTEYECDSKIVLMAVSNEYVYFVPEEKILLTEYLDKEECYSTRSRLSRISKTDGTVQLMNSYTRYDVDSVHFIGDKVLLKCYDQAPRSPQGGTVIYLASIDENGNVFDITPFGVE